MRFECTNREKPISGWGNRERVSSKMYRPAVFSDTKRRNPHAGIGNGSIPRPVIPRGNGRSYGDSSLQKNVICSRSQHSAYQFDETTGILECDSGVLLSEIINHVLTRGWFLPVTPGTSAITVGGAVAADVHGKNHHHAGCFSEYVEQIYLVTAEGEKITCSKQHNREFFLATCGGMGLTGYISRIRMRLERVPSVCIRQTSIRTHSLAESIEALHDNQHTPYSVAWIDLQKKGDQLGRGIIQLGSFSRNASSDPLRGRKPLEKPPIRIPESWPGMFIQKASIFLFNSLWYAINRKSTKDVSLVDFMYPLDKIGGWNHLFGKGGFIQYQLIIPEAVTDPAFSELAEILNQSDYICTLAVLKNHGDANRNYLSFPLKGYSLAMDFKPTTGLRKLLPRLNTLTKTYGGRINLCKDSLMDRELFDAGYPDAHRFRSFRKKHQLLNTFQSLQSDRLEL